MISEVAVERPPPQARDAQSRRLTMAFPVVPQLLPLCLLTSPGFAFTRQTGPPTLPVRESATGSPLRRAPGGQAPRCDRCPSTRALLPSQGRSASCETHVWVVKIHNPPPAPCTQELYLRPPCRKSRPLQRLTTHSGGFPAQ